MASALQLFNFQQQPAVNLVHTEVKKKRKRSVIANVAKGQKVNYICSGCEKEVTVETNAAVQCPDCNNRILDKLRVKESITYDAI